MLRLPYAAGRLNRGNFLQNTGRPPLPAPRKTPGCSGTPDPSPTRFFRAVSNNSGFRPWTEKPPFPLSNACIPPSPFLYTGFRQMRPASVRKTAHIPHCIHAVHVKQAAEFFFCGRSRIDLEILFAARASMPPASTSLCSSARCLNISSVKNSVFPVIKIVNTAPFPS